MLSDSTPNINHVHLKMLLFFCTNFYFFFYNANVNRIAPCLVYLKFTNGSFKMYTVKCQLCGMAFTYRCIHAS